MVKPLVFASAATPEKASGPKPLAFHTAPQAATPQVAAKPAISFPNQPAPKPVAQRSEPTVLFGAVKSPLIGDALKHIESKNAALFKLNEKRFELQVSQLLPVKMEVVMTWGSKTMERTRVASNDAAKLIAEFVSFDGNKMLEAAVKSVQPPTGMFGRFTQQKPTDFEPQIAVLLSSLGVWMQSCTSLIDKARVNHNDSVVKMISLSAVHDTVGEPPDQNLAHMLHNRRVLLQQGATQSELVLRQLESTYQQMIDQHMRAEQVMNVTIPAWKNAALK